MPGHTKFSIWNRVLYALLVVSRKTSHVIVQEHETFGFQHLSWDTTFYNKNNNSNNDNYDNTELGNHKNPFL